VRFLRLPVLTLLLALLRPPSVAMNSPNLPAVRLQFMGDGDCTVHDAVDARLDSSAPDSSDHQPLYWQHPLPPTLLPHFGRSLSMPTPSQLRNPHRSLDLSSSSRSAPISPDVSHCHEVSLELADSLQCIIQTMLQVSPQQVLDPAKEQFAACTFSVPTPCMSAMFAVMKNLNYISANMTALCAPFSDSEPPISDVKNSHAEHVDFDIGELMQSVGDGLSGAAAQAGADLVLYHGDAGLKHIWVRGDEDAISYSLSHVSKRPKIMVVDLMCAVDNSTNIELCSAR
jgi:osomolarity two-component system response regulator SSK1